MRQVYQRRRNDCGVACVAMLTGKTYQQAEMAIFPDPDPGYAEKRDVVAALRLLGRRPVSEFTSAFGRAPRSFRLRFDALVKCNYRAGTGAWHWVVWDARRQRFRDPLRQPYKRLRVHSYLRIDP